MDVEIFRQLATTMQIYYRNLAMNFHSLAPKGVEFPMKLSLKNWKEIKRIQDFILFTFCNHRAVISGDMSFVFKGR